MLKTFKRTLLGLCGLSLWFGCLWLLGMLLLAFPGSLASDEGTVLFTKGLQAVCRISGISGFFIWRMCTRGLRWPMQAAVGLCMAVFSCLCIWQMSGFMAWVWSGDTGFGLHDAPLLAKEAAFLSFLTGCCCMSWKAARYGLTHLLRYMRAQSKGERK